MSVPESPAAPLAVLDPGGPGQPDSAPAGHLARTPDPVAAQGRYVPVTPWTPLWGLGASALIMLGVVLLLAAAGVVISFLHPEAFERTPTMTRFRFDAPAVAYAFAAFMLVSQILGIAATFWFARRMGGRAREVLALRAPPAGAAAYAWAVPAFVIFGFGVGAAVQWLSPQSSLADTEIMLQLTRSPAWWLILIAAVVLAPLQEELLFRGFLFSALARSRWLGLTGTAILTSIGWAAIHGYSAQGDATIFMLGLALSVILWRTGSTRVTMACHGAYNALAFLAAAFAGAAGAG